MLGLRKIRKAFTRSCGDQDHPTPCLREPVLPRLKYSNSCLIANICQCPHTAPQNQAFLERGEVENIFKDEETGLEMFAEGQASGHEGVLELGLLGVFVPVGTGETLTGGAAAE